MIYKWIAIVLLSNMICLSTVLAQDLQSFQKEAAKNNPELLAKYKEFEAALSKIPQVGTLPDPNLSFGMFISPVETRVGAQRAKLSLSQRFPWFGTLSIKKDAAALMAVAKYQEFEVAKQHLFFQVSSAFYPLYELEQLKQIEEKNIELLTSFVTMSTAHLENGDGSMIDILRADLLLKEALTHYEILSKQQVPLLTQFNSILNRDSEQQVKYVSLPKIDSLPVGFHKDSLLLNPALSHLQSLKSAFEASEKVAMKESLPSFGLGLDYVVVSERNDISVADNGKDVLMPMVTMSIPIFREKYNAQIAETRLLQQSMELKTEAMQNSLASQYDQVWYQLEKNLSLCELYDTQLAQTQQVLNLLYAQYSQSGNDFEEVLRVQQQVLKYQQMQSSTQTQYYIALSEMNLITSNYQIQ